MKTLARKGAAFAVLLALVLLAPGSLCAEGLRDKIQKELDANPGLAGQAVQMHVLDEKDGCVAIEMTEGPKVLRDLFRRGVELDGAGLNEADLSEEALNALKSVRKALKPIKRWKGVKEITLTGATNPLMDQAENYYEEALKKMAQEDAKERMDAVELLKKAADMGLARAQGDLGSVYAMGVCVEKDTVKALELYRKAAANGDPSAQYNLGNIYAMGRGVNKNVREALGWLKKGAEQERKQEAKLRCLKALATILSTCYDESLRDGEAALGYAKEATVVAPRDRSVIEILAAAYARCGRFEEALEEQKKWIQVLEDDSSNPSAFKQKLLTIAKRRLALYQKNQPFTDAK